MNKIHWGNPFDHSEYSRTSLHEDDLTPAQVNNGCEWCGGLNRHGGLFEYDDTGKLFCGKGCFRIYYAD